LAKLTAARPRVAPTLQGKPAGRAGRAGREVAGRHAGCVPFSQSKRAGTVFTHQAAPGRALCPSLPDLHLPAAELSPILAPCAHCSFYLAEHPDVKAAGLDPLTHWCGAGVDEGRLSCFKLSECNGTSVTPEDIASALSWEGIERPAHLFLVACLLMPAHATVAPATQLLGSSHLSCFISWQMHLFCERYARDFCVQPRLDGGLGGRREFAAVFCHPAISVPYQCPQAFKPFLTSPCCCPASAAGLPPECDTVQNNTDFYGADLTTCDSHSNRACFYNGIPSVAACCQLCLAAAPSPTLTAPSVG